VLLLLNGAPGVGKSALAERYARDHALTLVVDIDELRTHLGRWEETDSSKSVARLLAAALVREHLGRGHDVVMPQYVGRREFVEQLRSVAAGAGTEFVEVVLTDDDDAVIERFRARRAALTAAGIRHPERDLADDALVDTIRAASAGLRRDAAAYGLPEMAMGSGVERSYEALLACVG
jgi:predicted kinase